MEAKNRDFISLSSAFRRFVCGTGHLLGSQGKKGGCGRKLNEWEGVPAITLNSNAYIVIANRSWKGPADLSGKIYVMWDEEYLYVACEIEDDVVIQEKEGTYLFQGDCIELYVGWITRKMPFSTTTH